MQQVLIHALLQAVAEERTGETVRQEDMEKYYREHYAAYNEPTLIRLSHILVASQPGEAIAQTRAQAEQIHRADIGQETEFQRIGETLFRRPGYGGARRRSRFSGTI